MKPKKEINYYENGEVECEEYWINGKRHRPTTDGPAYVYYFESGEVEYERYYINGKQATEEQIREIKFNLQFDKDVMEAL